MVGTTGLALSTRDVSPSNVLLGSRPEMDKLFLGDSMSVNADGVSNLDSLCKAIGDGSKSVETAQFKTTRSVRHIKDALDSTENATINFATHTNPGFDVVSQKSQKTLRG